MLTKPLIFALTFLLSIVNFVIILLPMAIVFFPIFIFMETLFDKVGMNMLYFLVSRISILMIAYLILDFLFGFTVRSYNKGNTKIEKAKAIPGHEEILASFDWLKQKFNMPNVELYVSPNYAEVNAYAVGSLRRKSIIITVGLLEKIKANSSNVKEYVEAVRGILGHEMSHLANHDYLPGLLTSANEVANCQISRALRWAFILIANCFRLLPQIGWYIHVFIVKIYNFFNFFINFFYRYIFMPIYNFICKWLSRSIEYRCDKESAYAFGGEAMARALSILGEGYYFSVFSTHPRTKSRIKNIQNVSPIGGVIRPRIFNSLSNLLSIALVLFVCVYSTQKTDVPAMYEHYLTEIYYPAQTKVAIYKQQAWSLYYTYVKPNM